MRVEIWSSSAQRHADCQVIEAEEGMLLWEALPSSLQAAITSQGLVMAIWGRVVGMSYRLQVGDRIELTRALKVDPMTARRERWRKQPKTKSTARSAR